MSKFSQVKANHLKAVSCCSAAVVLLGGIGGSAMAATLPGAAPAGVAVQSAGQAVSAVGQGHAGVAPTVVSTAPGLEPFADGVTNGLMSVGGGVSAAGHNIQSGGLTVTPVAGARTAVQTVRGGNLAQARAGQLALGQGSSTTVVGAGALSSAPPQGTLATAGVANANALLNANVAPQ